MVKVIINGTEIIETPDGWLNFTTTLRYDKELKALFEIVEAPLTFYHDGYRMIKAAYDANGYCFQYPVTILREDELNQYIPIFEGVLFFKDIEFTEGIEGYSAKCQFTDNSFFAKIYNNRNLKAKIYVPRSKSDLTIAAAPYCRAKFFDPATGTYYAHLGGPSDARNDTAFRVYAVLEFLVAFMSDGEVDFISDYFAPGGLGEGAMITCGKIPRFTQSGGMTQELFEEIWPDLSFADVFKELDKVYNLGIRAGFDGARPYIRIENNSFLFPNTTLQNLADVAVIKRKTALEYLYAKVVIGSTIVTDEVFLSFPADIRFVGTKEEEYIIVQDCNTDRELNLVNNWILDTNTIEDLVENYATVPTTNDAEIILIDCNYFFGNSQEAKQTNWLAVAPPYYYNEQYTNANKAQRYLGGVPANIAAYLSTTDDSFSAESSAPDPTFPFYYDNGNDPERLIECDVEISDPSGNYNNTAFYYEIPATGVYTFVGLVKMELYNFGGANVIDNTTTVFLRRTDSSNVLISETPVVVQLTSLPAVALYSQIISISGTAATLGNATDRIYLYVKVDGDLVSYRIYIDCAFGCVASSNGGGVYQEYDPRDYPIIRNQFEYPMSFKDFRTLKSQPLGMLSFGVKDSKTYFAWIEEIKYKHFADTSNFMLISNETTN
jgi:hypothetical protein